MSNQVETSIRLMRKGWLTALESAQRGGVLALSQRVGELRAQGYTVQSKWVTSRAGARHMAYKITALPTKEGKQKPRLFKAVSEPFFIF